ncbi:putative metal-binding motif-containing protein [Corallococcus macrosporus]|uniref:Metal-binding motif-containing protein n=1 Tax=Corallococcus macrosporus TaxID=35 RepID=A0ABS3DIX0_9BACT|nr:putative metal-binding motif-containing protein [Corallococcus macrosporus]MBN8231282.1 putative metal-binding motif-containing protein [Corallococcus macrosporus]
MHSRMKSLVVALLLAGCGSNTSPSGPEQDAGTQVDAGTQGDAGVTDDAGTPDSGVAQALPCEKTQGVCAGASRALVDGAYEAVCTARSYGEKYEATELSCDGLDNDCDGVTDPATWAQVDSLGTPPHGGLVDSLPVPGGFLMASVAGSDTLQVRRLDASLKLQAVIQVPVAPGPEPITSVSLVRTARGPALVYVGRYVTSEVSSRLLLVHLDEQGNPLGPPGGILIYEHFHVSVAARAAVSRDGQQVAVVWSATSDAKEVLGRVVDLDGRVVSGPWVVFLTKEEQVRLSTPTVMALEGGGFLLMVVEDHGVGQPSRIQLARYDGSLSSSTDSRVLDVGDSPTAMLLGDEPSLLYRDTSVRPSPLKQLRSVFKSPAPETLASTTEGEVPWFGATMTSRGLQMAWLSVRAVSPQGTGDTSFDWEGRFWTRGPDGSAKDQSPGPQPMPLHRHSQWVRVHELPGNWMGALLMTATEDPQAFTLQSVRYCAP